LLARFADREGLGDRHAAVQPLALAGHEALLAAVGRVALGVGAKWPADQRAAGEAVVQQRPTRAGNQRARNASVAHAQERRDRAGGDRGVTLGVGDVALLPLAAA